MLLQPIFLLFVDFPYPLSVVSSFLLFLYFFIMFFSLSLSLSFSLSLSLSLSPPQLSPFCPSVLFLLFCNSFPFWFTITSFCIFCLLVFSFSILFLVCLFVSLFSCDSLLLTFFSSVFSSFSFFSSFPMPSARLILSFSSLSFSFCFPICSSLHLFLYLLSC